MKSPPPPPLEFGGPKFLDPQNRAKATTFLWHSDHIRNIEEGQSKIISTTEFNEKPPKIDFNIQAQSVSQSVTALTNPACRLSFKCWSQIYSIPKDNSGTTRITVIQNARRTGIRERWIKCTKDIHNSCAITRRRRNSRRDEGYTKKKQSRSYSKSSRAAAAWRLTTSSSGVRLKQPLLRTSLLKCHSHEAAATALPHRHWFCWTFQALSPFLSLFGLFTYEAGERERAIEGEVLWSGWWMVGEEWNRIR